jgi:hypothetical protein
MDSSVFQESCKDVDLSVNPNQITAIFSTKNRNLNGFIKSTLFGSELELQNQVLVSGNNFRLNPDENVSSIDRTW